MPKFDADAALPALEWKFTRFQPATPEGAEPERPWQGTIPEPSVGDIQTFQKTVRSVSPTGDPTKLGDVSAADAADVFDTLRQALAELCHGSPTLAQIEALPFRYLIAFVGYVLGELGNPPSPITAT